MTSPQPPELFPDPDMRPARYDRHDAELAARRRRFGFVMVMIGLALILGGGIYAFFSGPADKEPREIPLIASDKSPAKERPATPGGIDVPHQDVTIFDQLGKKTDTAQVEHLLPPPEAPNPQAADAGKEPPEPAKPAVTPTIPVITTAPETPKAEKTEPAPSQKAEAPQEKKQEPAPVAAPQVIAAVPAPKSAPSPEPEKPAKPPEKMTETINGKTPSAPPSKRLDDILASVKPSAKSAETESAPSVTAEQPKSSYAPAKAGASEDRPAAAGMRRVQLAAYPNEAQARSELMDMVSAHAALMRNVKLSVVKADLGARGTYYRVQTQPMDAGAAQKLCAELKAVGLNCMLVAGH